MEEKKIYTSYAFSENEREKSKINSDIYKNLKGKYKVFKSHFGLVDGKDCNFSEYDVIIGRKAEYHHALYKIYKNTPDLSMEELALLCDGGNLCFGYTMQGPLIYVFED